MGTAPWNLPENYDDGRALVNEKFDEVKDFADDWLEYVTTYLDALWAALNRQHNDLPSTDVDFDEKSVSINYDLLDGTRPEAPTDEQLTPEDVAYPSLRYAIDAIVVPDILDLPIAPDDLESQELVFNESEFASELITDITSNLRTWLQDGGTGLGADAEDALWERNLDRLQDQYDRDCNQIDDYYGNGGWVLPPGARNGVLLQIQGEHTRNLLQRGHEITVNEATLQHETSKFAITASTNLDDMLQKYHDAMQARAFELAKAKVAVIIDSYNAKVEQYKTKVEATKVSAQAAEVEVNAHAAKNKDIVDLFKADIQGYAEQLRGEFGLVESIAKVYGYKVAGYEADARAAATIFDSKIKKYMADIDQEKAITILEMDEVKLLFDAFFKLSDTDIEGYKTLAGICAQLAASALGRANVSATLGYSQGFSVSDSTSRTDPLNQEHTTYSYSP